MIKFTHGWIETATGARKDIVVKAAAPNTLKDALIGGCLTLIGVAYLTVTAFKNGSKKYEEAEFKTMEDLGLLQERDIG